MFAIEFNCGHKRGGWLPTSERYPTRQAAQNAIDRQTAAEARRDLTSFLQRVREA